MPGLTMVSHQKIVSSPASLICCHSSILVFSLDLKIASCITEGFDLKKGLDFGDIIMLILLGSLILITKDRWSEKETAT